MDVGRVRGLRRRPALATALIVLLIFLGISGLFGGGAFIAAPDGHLIRAPESWLEDIPFPDFLIPGLFLFFVVGVLSLVSAGALLWRSAWPGLQRIAPFRGQYWGWTVTGLAGLGILIFEIVESVFIGLSWPQMFYGGIGAAIVLLALSRPVRQFYRVRRLDRS